MTVLPPGAGQREVRRLLTDLERGGRAGEPEREDERPPPQPYADRVNTALWILLVSCGVTEAAVRRVLASAQGTQYPLTQYG